jgi:hypothetical protein
MLLVWGLLGAPVAFFILRDDRFETDLRRERLRIRLASVQRFAGVMVVLIALIVFWPVALLGRKRITAWLAGQPWMTGGIQRPERARRPMRRWKVNAYRALAVLATGSLVVSVFERAALWFAVPASYALVAGVAGKLPNQRRQIFGRAAEIG